MAQRGFGGQRALRQSGRSFASVIACRLVVLAQKALVQETSPVRGGRRCAAVKRAVHFYAFDQSGRFSDEKSLFFRSCSELPRVDDPSRSEAENHCFSASTSSPLTFRDIFVIFVRSPSRIFRKITILSTVSTMNTRRFVKKNR